jgi:hypothetical protein
MLIILNFLDDCVLPFSIIVPLNESKSQVVYYPFLIAFFSPLTPYKFINAPVVTYLTPEFIDSFSFYLTLMWFIYLIGY